MRMDAHAGFELTEHTADVGIRAFGTSREDVFEQTTLAMASLLCDPATVEPREEQRIVLTAESDDPLLAAWLNELLFVFEAATYHDLQLKHTGEGWEGRVVLDV